MTDYIARIIVEYQLQAANEDQAQARAERLSRALTPVWVHGGILPRDLGKAPTWLGDMEYSEVEVEA